MNQEKIGRFIAELRKEKKMTQVDLANKLGITDRAISKWENGRGMPDLSLLTPLCEILDVSINELLSGERLDKKNYQEKLEENIINTIDYTDKKIKKTKKMTPEEVANSLSFSQDGKLTFSGRNISAFKKEEIVYKYKPILLSEEVYTNYQNEHSQRVDIQKKMWIKESRKIKDISYNVWGADLHWSIS